MSRGKITVKVRDVAHLDGMTSDAVLKRLYAYWLVRCDADRYPSRSDIDPIEFGFALGRVSLIDVVGPPLRFRCRLVSTAMTEHLGYEMTGKFVDQIPELETRAYAQALYTKAVSQQAPLFVRDEIVLDRRRWTSEALILPLTANGKIQGMLMIYRSITQPELER